MYALWMFYGDQFKEIYSPDVGTWMTQVLVDSTESGLPMDIIFPVRTLEGRIFAAPPAEFVWGDTHSGAERPLELETPYSFICENISILVRLKRVERKDLTFAKYNTPRDVISVGRNDRCSIVDPNGSISSIHGYLNPETAEQATYTDQSSNGTFLNGHKIMHSTVRVQFGDILMFPSGLKLVYLGKLIALNQGDQLTRVTLTPAAKQETPPPRHGNGDLPSLYVQYHRAPRMMQRPDTTTVEIEPPIAKQGQTLPPAWQQVGPAMTMVLPMGVSTMVMMAANQNGRNALPTGLIMIGTSSMLAVMWAILNRRYRKKQNDELEAHRIQLYQQYITEIEATLRELNTREYQRLTTNFPNVGECVSLPTDGSRRLWNRMPTHSDFLHVRLGIGAVDLPAQIVTQKQKLSIIDDPLRDEPDRLKGTYSVVSDAPVTMNLRRESVVGILGGDEAALFAQGLLMQIAALHSYHDVRIAVLTDLNTCTEWTWARWLPHVFASEDREMRMVASSPAAVHEIMSHLSDVLNMRRSAEEESGDKQKEKEADESLLPLPHYVIFCTSPNLLENEPIMRQLLTSHLGMTLVMIAPSLEFLPKECNFIFNVAAKPGMLHTSDGDTKQVDYEYPNRNLLTSFSRNIAPLRVKDAAENAAIPTLVSFLDIYNVRRTEDLDVWRMWSENHTYEGLRSIIGYTSGSHPFVLDISDKYHGPHGLIAGTTGSGKSVMLQTYILSLALNYSPEQVQFILIDYKGGGMADPFLNLPHTAGIIDNLQGSRTISRALASLNGEIHRRERIFKAHDVSSINDYTQMFGSDPNEIKLPHLIIIVDEFAELKSEQPDFMRELVSASRVGRSLGVHLILATQKPSNSVSDEIWANSRFHLCLRVQTRGDSMEMLKRPDAAYIKGMGRCFVQIGNDELFEQVQTSYSGLAYNPDEPRPEEMPQLLDESGQVVRTAKRRKSAEEKRNEVTQMDAVLKRIVEVAAEHGMDHSKPLWLPEMPPQIYFGDMQLYADQMVRGGVYCNPSEGVSFLLGMADDVMTQRYIPCMVNLTDNRNLMLVGIAGTGKTTAIQSMVASLCSRYDPAHLNIYILSLTSQTLGNLAAFPQVGDLLFENDVIEMQRFINMMFDESVRRAKLFAQASTDSFVEYNRGMEQKGLPQEPAIVVFIDRFEQLKATFANNDFYTGRIHTLIREGSSRGIHFVVTALAKNEIPGKLHSFFGGVALQLRERSDYTDVLGKRVPFDRPPIAAYPGRAMAVIGENKEIYEVQIGLGGVMPEVMPDCPPFSPADLAPYALDTALQARAPLTDVDRAANIIEFANELRARWSGPLPASVPRVPEKPIFREFAALPQFQQCIRSNYALPVGYNMNDGSLACVDLEKNYSMLVTGTKKSGVTNQLKVIAKALHLRGAQVHVIGNADWKSLCDEIGASLYQTEDEIIAYIDRFVAEVPAKRQPLKKKAEPLGRAQLRMQALEFSPYALIIDNADRLAKEFNAPRFAKSPAQLVNESQQAHDRAVSINAEGEKAAREAAEGEVAEFTPVAVPPVKTAAELAPGQNPKRTVSAKVFVSSVLAQMSSIAEYYNVFVFMGLPQSERAQLAQEPLKTLAAQGRGIELGGRLTDYDPLNVSQAVPGWTSQARAKALGAGNGYMLTDAGMINLRTPLIEEEEE